MADDADDLIKEALDNIRNDRKLATEFLNEIANVIANSPHENRNLSPVAAKHIETLQRSNEQLVKIISIKKKDKDDSFDFSLEDRDKIFSSLQQDKD